MSSTNSKSAPRASGSTLILQSPKLAVAAGLFLWRPCASVDALIVSRYGNARRFQVDADAEAALQLRHGDLDVKLTLARQQLLLGLRIAACT